MPAGKRGQRILIPRRVKALAPPRFDVLNHTAAELRALGHDVISLGQAVPAFGPPPAALDAARRALDRADAHGYSADAGLATLRAALCEKLRATWGGDAAPSDLIVTAGANQACMLALMTLIDPGDEVLLAAPYFANHQMAVAALGGVATEVPLDEAGGFVARWADLQPHVSARTRAVVVCTPSNPTGAVIPEAEMRRIVQELGARGIALVSDETYARFVYDAREERAAPFASAAAVPGWRENVVVVSTFSKSFGMTGWRVGYMLADRRVCDEAIKIQDAMIICAPVVSQLAVEAAIRENWDYPLSFGPTLLARRRKLAELVADIPGLHWRSTAGGFFAFVRVDGCTDAAALAQQILERAHVVTIPGTTFGECGEGFLRLSYGAADEPALVEACRRLRRFFAP